MAPEQAGEIRLKGISASPGICIGKAYLVDREGVDVVKRYLLPKERLGDEVKRFKAAVKKATDEVRAIIDRTPEDLREHALILETHLVLLKDKMLYNRTIDVIQKKRFNAEWALRTVMGNVKGMFAKMTDPYLKARVTDIEHVSDLILRNLVGANSVKIAEIDKRVILVAHDLSPSETSQIQLERIMGFVTDRGGKASHTGIIAQALEIPAVLGLDTATRIVKNDDIIIVDGSEGVLIINPEEQTLLRYEERRIGYERFRAAITRDSHLPAETVDGFRLKVMGNIELPEEVVSVIDNGGEGIGLYRTEFQYLSRTDFPTEFELYDKYRDVVEVMAPLPVTIRTLDINGDKVVAYTSGATPETNPALGLRAIRYCLKKPQVFKTQLRAILRASAHGNVRVMFPMIASLAEVKEAKRLLAQCAAALEKEGVPFNRDIQTGIMIEVPSAVVIADILAREVDFFSIGTNDLIQYTLAIDRGNREVAHLFSPLHPAILRMLDHLSKVAAKTGVKLFMCGEMAADPMNMPILLGMGLEELSVNPRSMPVVKSMIRSLSREEACGFFRKVLEVTSSAETSRLIQDSYGGIVSQKFQVPVDGSDW
ncbi:MAG TPA: phosphoenolpyruvate--protein phosphotransferase [Desulfobacterales bacterium]|nr:phosphoenolpyruvate--protein phosphotransferase [Desulfobacterales bacterium]